MILVNSSTNRVGIFYGSEGNWTLKYYWVCATGKSSSPTVKGTFTVLSKGLAFGSGYTCWYYTQFYGNYLFHSILYNSGSMTSIQESGLGTNASHGCVRLSLTNAKWIYDNIPIGTKVVSY
ncbi:MAG: L,D-transpeptidase [Lachnospiraceae bacterium]|nr:L,D-transpeptidase [Lachnospiraceae bacterium]